MFAERGGQDCRRCCILMTWTECGCAKDRPYCLARVLLLAPVASMARRAETYGRAKTSTTHNVDIPQIVREFVCFQSASLEEQEVSVSAQYQRLNRLILVQTHQSEHHVRAITAHSHHRAQHQQPTRLTFLSATFKMKYLAAYLLLQLGGNESPAASDIKTVLESVGIDADSERLDKLISELEGKNIQEV